LSNKYRNLEYEFISGLSKDFLLVGCNLTVVIFAAAALNKDDTKIISIYRY